MFHYFISWGPLLRIDLQWKFYKFLKLPIFFQYYFLSVICNLAFKVSVLFTFFWCLIPFFIGIHFGKLPTTFSIIASCSESHRALKSGSPEYSSTRMHATDQMSDFSSHSADSICISFVITSHNFWCSILTRVDNLGFVLPFKRCSSKINDFDLIVYRQEIWFRTWLALSRNANKFSCLCVN